MMIIVSDFYSDTVQAIEKACLKDELDYHFYEYGCRQKKIYILPFSEALNEKYKLKGNTLILSV